MDFNKIDNYRFHDPLLYPISAVERSKHLYLPQINYLSMILPPAPLLTQYKDIPQVHTYIFKTSVLIQILITLDYHQRFKKNRLNCHLHKKVIKGFHLQELLCNYNTVGRNCSSEYCECVHVEKVGLGDVVEFVLVDEGKTFDANHPMHLHGYSYRVVAMGKVRVHVQQ